jgi:uncharacterized protein (DUF2062 family)
LAQAETPVPGARARFRSLAGALAARVRDLWERALREHSSPRETGLSVGVGVFSGCTPFLGFHLGIAILLATALRLNRLWAALGSRFSILPVFLWVTFGELEVAHRLRTGAWADLTPKSAFAHANDLLADWALGTVVVGGGLALAAGLLAYALAVRSLRRASRTRAAARPLSSEYLPSARPAPPP